MANRNFWKKGYEPKRGLKSERKTNLNPLKPANFSTRGSDRERRESKRRIHCGSPLWNFPRQGTGETERPGVAL